MEVVMFLHKSVSILDSPIPRFENGTGGEDVIL